MGTFIKCWLNGCKGQGRCSYRKGVVDSYAEKVEAETAAKNVAGLKAIVEDIEIKYSRIARTSDGEMANDGITSLEWKWQFESDKIEIKVEDGWVTLEGELTWNYKKEAAKNEIIHT